MSVASSNATTTNRTIHNECATNQLVIVGMDGRKKINAVSKRFHQIKHYK